MSLELRNAESGNVVGKLEYGTNKINDTSLIKKYDGTNVVGFQGVWPQVQPLSQVCTNADQ